jgi:hypothetical protein
MADSPQAAARLVSTAALEETGLRSPQPGMFSGPVEQGWLLLSEASSTRWDVRLDGRRLRQLDNVPGNMYEVPSPGQLEIASGPGMRHLAVIGAQLLVVIAIVSLAIRPPRSGMSRRGIDDVHVGPHPAPMPGPAARAAAAATITGDLR